MLNLQFGEKYRGTSGSWDPSAGLFGFLPASLSLPLHPLKGTYNPIIRVILIISQCFIPPPPPHSAPSFLQGLQIKMQQAQNHHTSFSHFSECVISAEGQENVCQGRTWQISVSRCDGVFLMFGVDNKPSKNEDISHFKTVKHSTFMRN